MTDRETVEEKNEVLRAIYAVQDALKVGLYDAEWRRQRADDEGSAEIHKKQIEEGQDALSLIRDRLIDPTDSPDEGEDKGDLCVRCGHDVDAHRFYNADDWCGECERCGCEGFRRSPVHGADADEPEGEANP